MAFKVGDVVRLKSGGADMTVTGDGMLGEVICVWHSPTIKGGHDTKTASYPAEALILKSEADKQSSTTWDAASSPSGSGRRGNW